MTALVESPLQLLSAVEAHAAGHAGARSRVLARADVPALASAVDDVRALGLPGGLSVDLAPVPRRLPHDVVVVGDPFSGAFQSALVRSLRPPTRIVVVDDGLATLDLAHRLTSGSSLVRIGAPPGSLRYGLGALAALRMRRVAEAGGLSLCTALPLDPDLRSWLRLLGIGVLEHGFEWLRGRAPASAPAEPTVVVGSPLAADGLVQPDRYVAWVRGVAADGPLRYVPHRRHDPRVSALLEQVPGVEVDTPGAPVEMRLRGLRPGQRVVTLPSAAALTLPRVLLPRGVAVVPHAVPGSWWTDRATPELRHRLTAAHELATRVTASPVAGPPLHEAQAAVS
ncbi:hypothetical protein ACH436_08705 [Isoptericola sp. NPDC019693]|uniref:hypothetical protein n=1 Tax=Isoptericola sp. NPDC019693 TaxID=3364009 RepID=UPI0037B0944D